MESKLFENSQGLPLSLQKLSGRKLSIYGRISPSKGINVTMYSTSGKEVEPHYKPISKIVNYQVFDER